MNKLSSITQRVQAPTPVFFKKLRTIGLTLAAISGALVVAPAHLPAIVTEIAGYVGIAGSVLSAVSQTAVEDNVKHMEEVYE
jgi:hypothetical protein